MALKPALPAVGGNCRCVPRISRRIGLQTYMTQSHFAYNLNDFDSEQRQRYSLTKQLCSAVVEERELAYGYGEKHALRVANKRQSLMVCRPHPTAIQTGSSARCRGRCSLDQTQAPG